MKKKIELNKEAVLKSGSKTLGEFKEFIAKGNVLDMAVNLDIVEKAGSWFSYDGDRIGQGRENVKKYLKENPLEIQKYLK